MSDMLPIAPGPQAVDPHALAERRRRRGRRRLAVWGAFLLLGLLLGTIYATGFTTIEAAEGTPATATALGNSPTAKQDESTKMAINPVTTTLTWTWTGRWGEVGTAVMDELKLTGIDPVDKNAFEASDLFYSEVVLVNTPTRFSDLQLQFRIAEIGATEECATVSGEKTVGQIALESAAAGGGAVEINKRVMYFDTADAQVTFSGMEGDTTGLPGAARYCVGIINYSGKDPGGTFIRKYENGTTFEGEYPEFVVTLNRKA